MTRRVPARPLLVTILMLVAAACAAPEPTRQYVLQGQILEVHPDRMALTVRHEAIPDFMAAMTMTFEVADRRLLDGRTPGELITATLEVQDSLGRLVSITHTGHAPLPPPGGAAGVLAIGDAAPDAAFVDQADRRRSFGEWHGTATVLTFADTRCALDRDCAALDRRVLQLQRTVATDPRWAGRVRIVTVSLAPGLGTATEIAGYAASRKADPAVWTVLTGDMVTRQRFAARFGVALPDAAGDAGAIDRTVVMNAEGRVVALHDGGWTPAALLAALDTPQSAR